MPTTEAAIVNEARRVARLQAKARRLRRDLKDVAAELRLAKRNIKALASSTGDPFNQTPPLRMFGERASGE